MFCPYNHAKILHIKLVLVQHMLVAHISFIIVRIAQSKFYSRNAYTPPLIGLNIFSEFKVF